MAIFGIIDLEPTIQVDDKIRLHGIRSFTTQDETSAITAVEIEPEGGNGFIDVTPTTATNSTLYYLDWIYTGSSRTVTVSLRITTDGAPVTVTRDLSVVTAADDNLWSNDEALADHETELKSLLPPGKSSFKYAHRKAKELIIDWFDESGYTDFDGVKLDETAFTDLSEVRRWSEMKTLQLIFKDLSNSVGDKFDQKRGEYASRETDAKRRTMFRLDLNADSTIDLGEHIRVQSLRMTRR